MGEKQNKRKTGSGYEALAADYLLRQGYKILERNFHAGKYGELDLIARDRDGTLVICECKYRQNSTCGDPLEAVNERKQRQISRVTLFYYRKCGYGLDQTCRFDVIAVYGDGSIRHIKDAFDFWGGFV